MNPVRLLRAVCLVALLFAPNGSARAEEMPPGYVSPQSATLFSFFGTAVPVATGMILSRDAGESGASLVLVGLVIGPSMGHFYSQRPGRALGGIALRGLAVAGLGAAFTAGWDNPSSELEMAFYGCAAVGAASVAFDVFGAAGSARKHNETLSATEWSVGPALLGDARVPGIRVDISY